MADNITLNAGSGGDTLAADDISSVWYQRVKLTDGTADSATPVNVGNGVAANALRVTLASDGTGQVKLAAGTAEIGKLAAGTASIGVVDLGATDNAVLDAIAASVAGTLTVGSHAVTNAGTFAVQSTLQAGTAEIGKLAAGTASIGTLGANSGVDIGDVDVTSIIPGTGATNLGKAIDTAAGATDTGMAALAVRDDALTTLTPIDGDYVPLRVSSTGALHVTGGGGGTEYTEDVATADPQVGTATLMERDDALTTVTPVEGDWIGLRGSAEGALWTQDFNSDAALTALQLIDNAVSGAGFNITQLNGATVPIGAGTEAAALRVTVATDSTGVLTVDGTVTANAGSGTMTVDLGANNDVVAAGDVAHDAADSGNPVKVGGKAKAFDGTAPGTDVAENDRADAITTVEGRQFVEITHPNYWRASADYASAQTNATVKTAPGASLKLYVTDVIISNGAVAGNITLLDGSAGTVLLELYPAINGGLTHSFRTPLALTANTLLAITSTTVTTHSATVTGFIAA